MGTYDVVISSAGPYDEMLEKGWVEHGN